MSGSNHTQVRGKRHPGSGVGLGEALRRLHPHPQKAAVEVSARIGASVRTVEKWLAGETRPEFDATLDLIDAYGAALLALWFPGREWDELARDAEIAALRGRLEARLAERAAAAR